MCKIRFKAIGRAIWIVLLIPIYLASCDILKIDGAPTPTQIEDPDLIDRSWLTGDPCLPPCWYDMEIGITTFEDASHQVRSLSFIDPGSISVGESNWYFPTPRDVVPAKGIGLYCRQPESQVCARLWFVEDVLVDIFLFPNYKITFPEAVELLGEPEVISIDQMEPDRCTVSITWREYQTSITYVEFYKNAKRRLCQLIFENDYKIPKDLSVWNVSIRSKESYVDLDNRTINLWQGFIDP